MFGPFIEDSEEPEHDLAPMLKLIDFGSAGVINQIKAAYVLSDTNHFLNYTLVRLDVLITRSR